jgi:hypothetical protein
VATYTVRNRPVSALIHALISLVIIFLVVWLLNAIFPGVITWYVHHLHLNALSHMTAGKAFFFGLLQGLLFLVDWVVTLFRHNADVYQQGAQPAYKLGFLVGVVLFILGAFRSLW